MPPTVDFPTIVKQALELFGDSSLTTNPPGGILPSTSPG